MPRGSRRTGHCRTWDWAACSHGSVEPTTRSPPMRPHSTALQMTKERCRAVPTSSPPWVAAPAARGRRAEAAETLDRLAATLERDGRIADACDVARRALELAESRGR